MTTGQDRQFSTVDGCTIASAALKSVAPADEAVTPTAMILPIRKLARSPRVSVVIPALNEAKNLEHVIPELPCGLFEVVLVDGGSVDGTVETVRRLRPNVRVVSQTRRGKGNALACGFAACTGDIIVTLDADGSADPAEIFRFVDALVAGADFAKGSRFLEGGGSHDITHLRSIGNRFLGSLVNFAFGVNYSDLCYGYNAFWSKAVLPVLDLHWQSSSSENTNGRLWGDGFEIETLVNVRIAEASLKVVEVPSYERPRLHGVSNLHAVRDGLRVLRTILVEHGRSRRLRNEQRELVTRCKRASVCESNSAIDDGANSVSYSE